MRVRSISVRKLFGRFDHTIPLNLDERITIIHGPNGYGKTALLRLIDAAFRFDSSTLGSIPFQTLCVDLDDGSYLEVSPVKTSRRRGRGRPDVLYVFSEDKQPLVTAVYRKEHARWGTSSMDDAEELYREASDELSRVPTAGEMLDILRQKRPGLDDEFFLRFWLRFVSVALISVQRFFTPTELEPLEASMLRQDKDEGEALTFDQTVIVYSKDLRKAIGQAQAGYTSRIQDLDRTFPKRLMAAMKEPAPSDAEIARKLRELDEQRQRLARLGVLPSEDTGTEVPASIADDATRKLLWLYACDVEAKLEVFADFAGRAELLQELINQRFQFKRLRLDAERGFVFESDAGEELPPTALSSGEQHQLIMLYECLFAIDEDALLLVDEPELSLHVSWQVEFLHDLQRIIDIARFDVLIATHSPQIIHNRWDLTIELQPPSEPPVSITSEVPVVEQEAALE